MNEVTKLYKNAGVLMQDCLRKYYCVFDKSNKNCIVSEKCKTKDCAYLDDNSFTAEKQLELIKWLGELDMLEIMRTTREYKAWIINSEYGMSGNVYKHTSRMKSFEEALAELINSLWQDLTEAEKAQVKGILE